MPDDAADAGPPALDVTLVAVRRPALLRDTLASFSDGLFRHFRVEGVFANIDPVFGDAADQAACRAAIRERFPSAEIFEPPTACFGAAVQRVWGATRGALVFHLEDDWRLNAPIMPAEVLPLLTGATRAVAPVSREMGWNGRDLYNRRRRKVRVLGVPVARRDFQVFGTSPRFLDGAFARAAAALIDPALDPEKQMRPPGNPALIRYLQDFHCRFLPPVAGAERITDTGRAWRDERGIAKRVRGAVSSWEERS